VSRNLLRTAFPKDPVPQVIIRHLFEKSIALFICNINLKNRKIR